jgi:hypothetical protein
MSSKQGKRTRRGSARASGGLAKGCRTAAQGLTCYEIILDKRKLSCFVTSVVIGAAEQDVEVVNLERSWVEVGGDEERGE